MHGTSIRLPVKLPVSFGRNVPIRLQAIWLLPIRLHVPFDFKIQIRRQA
jgi:hypothetical protein